MEVYEGTLDSLQEAAVYDSEVEELMVQTMTPQMILGTTLLESEDADEFPNGENYLRYTYTNQYSFYSRQYWSSDFSIKRHETDCGNCSSVSDELSKRRR